MRAVAFRGTGAAFPGGRRSRPGTATVGRRARHAEGRRIAKGPDEGPKRVQIWLLARTVRLYNLL